MHFRLPTEIIFDSGAIGRLPQIIKERFQASRPLLVSDRGVEKAGHVDKLLSLFKPVDVFLEIEANPKHPTIDSLGEKARLLCPDLVVGLGGGSVLDAAKAIALLVSNPGKIENYEGREKFKMPPLPVLAIPTTCGTGSEVTWVSVITHTERRFKMSIKGKGLFPKMAILDPDLLATLPSPLVASTGLDALTHAVEAAIVKSANRLSDLFAAEAMKLILNSLPRAYANISGDGKAREDMLFGSMLAGVAFGNADVAAVHCLSESLGALFDVPHGIANAVFLAPVLEFLAFAAREKLAIMASWAGLAKEGEEVGAALFLKRIKELKGEMAIPSLRDLGVSEADFSEIAQRSAANNSNPSNPRPMGEKDYFEILSKAFQS